MDNANAVVEVPAWAWTLLGGAAVLFGGKALGFVLDIILIQFKGKDGGTNGANKSQADLCAATCKVQWEGYVATAISASQTALGAKIDTGFQRVHERIDEMMREK